MNNPVVLNLEFGSGIAPLGGMTQKHRDDNMLGYQDPWSIHARNAEPWRLNRAVKAYEMPLVVNSTEFRYTVTEAITSRSLPRTQTEIYELAQWTFGPRGLPDLQILALVDFSDRGYTIVVLYRNGLVEDQD